MFGKKIAIDLGTANSLVYVAGEGIVINEPTVVAVQAEDRRVVAVGNDAKTMLGRTPSTIVASRPMRDGVIADYAITEALLSYLIQKAVGRRFWLKPEVMLCVPAGCTQVERRAALDAASAAGARLTYLIDEPLAAAIGAGIPIAEARGSMILDIGGGAAETAVISLGGVVAHKSTRIGGNKLDEAITEYARRVHSLIIGEQTAELIKIKIGSATKLQKTEGIKVKGRDAVTGLPKTITLSSEDVYQALQKPLGQIISMLKAVLEETPPELASDIIDRGIVMSGGTSQLRNLDALITREIGVAAYLAEEPLLCVVKGTGKALENVTEYKRALR